MYDLKVEKEQLCIYVDDEQLACMNPVNEQLFNEVHFGYLQFEKTANGSISKFTINDESAKNIEFVRITDS